jgi:hypothetical protein
MTVDFSQPDNPRLGSYSLPKRIVQWTFTTELKQDIKYTKTMMKT